MNLNEMLQQIANDFKLKVKEGLKQKYWDRHGAKVSLREGLILDNCPFNVQPYEKSFAILESQHAHDDMAVIQAIDNIMLFYYTELPQSQRSIVTTLIMKVKNAFGNSGTYTVGDQPFKGIYADIIVSKPFWVAQIMFGENKTPNLLSMLTDEQLGKWRTFAIEIRDMW